MYIYRYRYRYGCGRRCRYRYRSEFISLFPSAASNSLPTFNMQDHGSQQNLQNFQITGIHAVTTKVINNRYLLSNTEKSKLNHASLKIQILNPQSRQNSSDFNPFRSERSLFLSVFLTFI